MNSILRHVTAWSLSDEAKVLDTERLTSSIKNRWPVYAEDVLQTENSSMREQTLARLDARTKECERTLPQRLKAGLEKFGRN